MSVTVLMSLHCDQCGVLGTSDTGKEGFLTEEDVRELLPEGWRYIIANDEDYCPECAPKLVASGMIPEAE